MTFTLDGTGGLQYTSDLSTPQGDAEDWVGFTPSLPNLSLRLTCLGNGDAQLEIWQNGQPLATPLACGADTLLTLTAGQPYLAWLRALNGAGGLAAVRYTLILSTVR